MGASMPDDAFPILVTDPAQLPERFREPPGFLWGEMTNADGAALRFGWIEPAGARATVILLGGYREFIEKYFEVIRWLTDRHLAVWTLDWRGQGASSRWHDDPMRAGAGTGYECHVDDLVQFLGEIVEPVEAAPVGIFAHSMGAHFSLRFLHDHPHLIDYAVLSAPMIRFRTAGIPWPMARLIARTACRLGWQAEYGPGCRPWTDPGIENPATSPISSDPDRCRLMADWYRIDPKLSLGNPSFGWIEAGVRSSDILRDPAYLREIETPVLMSANGRDPMVRLDDIVRASEIMPRASTFRTRGTRPSSSATAFAMPG